MVVRAIDVAILRNEFFSSLVIAPAPRYSLPFRRARYGRIARFVILYNRVYSDLQDVRMSNTLPKVRHIGYRAYPRSSGIRLDSILFAHEQVIIFRASKSHETEKPVFRYRWGRKKSDGMKRVIAIETSFLFSDVSSSFASIPASERMSRRSASEIVPKG